MGRWNRVLRTPLGLVATVLTVVVLALAVLGPVLWQGRAGVVDTNRILAGPSGAHWAGTDNLGRDILLRVLVAARLSVGLALIATLVAVVVGLVLGSAPFLLGRSLGRLVSAFVNITVAFPGLLLALFFAVIFGVGAKGAVLAIGLAGAPGFARLTQTMVAGVGARDYVAAARVAGVGRLRILTRHVLPNIAEPLVVNATIGAGGALLSFAGLSFLGLGVQSPAYDWGRLLYDGVSALYVNPAAALTPGAAVIVAGLSFNLFGEAVAKALGVTAAIGTVGRRTVPPAPVRPEVAPAAADDAASGQSDVVLDVRDLQVSFPGAEGPVRPVRGVSFTVRRGEAVGIVGESGSGKSLTALAVSRLVDDSGRVDAARLDLLGHDLRSPSTRTQRRMLGTSLAMVFQDPMTSFNPTSRIGRQLAEVARHHQGMTRHQARERAVDRLRAVRISDPARRARQYPHEFSGGMRQRIMIALGIVLQPRLIIADEPTTSLDVIVESQILDILDGLRRDERMGLMLITHNLGIVAETCDRIAVMYAGKIVEIGSVEQVFAAPRHPYTQGLLASTISLDTTELHSIAGHPPDLVDPPPGCRFAPRCPQVMDRCTAAVPTYAEPEPGHSVACHLYPGAGGNLADAGEASP